MSATISPGRILLVEAVKESHSYKFLNVHNHNVLSCELQSVCEIVKSEADAAKEFPFRRSMIVSGDLNFTREGTKKLRLQQPFHPRHGETRDDAYQSQRSRWDPALRLMTELEQYDPTHYSAASSTCSSIDRAS